MLQSLVVKISALIVKKQIGCKSDQYKKDQLSQINTYLPDIGSDIKKKTLKLKKLYYIIKKQTMRMFFKKGCTLETQGIVCFGFFWSSKIWNYRYKATNNEKCSNLKCCITFKFCNFFKNIQECSVHRRSMLESNTILL